jgi:hypothetical protein
MPKTKLSKEIESKQKPIIRLIDIPDLPLTLSMEKAADIAGVGRQYIKGLADTGKIKVIASGSKRVIPTWKFLVDMQLFPEPLMEKIYIERMKNEKSR